MLEPDVPHSLGPATAEMTRRRPLGFELVLVVLLALAVNVPGIWSYSLVDPWETHYGEVSRMMLQEHDWVHLDWPGGMDPKDHEGFRSKPVLPFWAMAASLKAFGIAKDGGYSGEMVDSKLTMVAIRMPFVLFAVMGLVLMWWMLARLVNRRLAWLSLLVVGSTPFYCLVARQAIPDMPLVACVVGALAMFTMASEETEHPLGDHLIAFRLRLGRHRIDVNHLHVFLAIVGGLLLLECGYDVMYFLLSPRIAVRQFPNPALFIGLLMALLFGGLSRVGWTIVRFPFVIVGSIIAFFAADKRYTLEAFDDWDRFAPDRFAIRVLSFPLIYPFGHDWAATASVAEHLLRMSPIATMRQIYLLWSYTFVGVSILAKGPPGLAVVGLVAAFHIILLGRWRALYEGKFEVKRALLLIAVVAVPWHIGMYLKEGVRFIDEYLFTHILNRAAVGVDNSPGTFATLTGGGGSYTTQVGLGMWLWAALLPAAFTSSLLRSRTDTREGRVRFMMVLWAVSGFAFFCVVQTKFHHYILPIVPALGILVAFLLDDILAGRDRLHAVYAALAIGIVLLVTRDLMWEPERWIEMFVYRYDRPWPNVEPYSIDPSDGFFVLGGISVVAIAIAASRFRRIGVAALCATGLAICIWSLQVYMPDAGKHWGMREAMRTYYEKRTIYGEKNIYFTASQIYDDWHGVTSKWDFETFIPDTMVPGQPMTIHVQLERADREDVTEQDVAMLATVTHIGKHDVEVTFMPGERAKLDALVARGQHEKPKRARDPLHIVDADHLIAWQLYWRGENFWSGDEIFGFLPEMKTGFNKTDNADFQKYIVDRSRAPIGRRYFLVTEAGRATSTRSMLPTARGKESFEVLDTTSNKFSLVAFYL